MLGIRPLFVFYGMFKLSERLAAVAELAMPAERILDVGTDHGYIPVYLALSGAVRRIGASDINEGPLYSAMRSAERCGVRDRIEFFLSDGLTRCPDGWDAIMIAGMGGETMINILASSPFPLGDVRLVLQPQSKLWELESWLGSSRFVCSAARLVEDAGKLYAAFTAERGEGGFDLLAALARARDPLLRDFLETEREKLRRAIAGMEQGCKKDERYSEARARLDRTGAALEEVLKW